jgi:hypothetical protein
MVTSKDLFIQHREYVQNNYGGDEYFHFYFGISDTDRIISDAKQEVKQKKKNTNRKKPF